MSENPYRWVGSGVPGAFARAVRIESLLKIVGDPAVPSAILALEQVQHPGGGLKICFIHDFLTMIDWQHPFAQHRVFNRPDLAERFAIKDGDAARFQMHGMRDHAKGRPLFRVRPFLQKNNGRQRDHRIKERCGPTGIGVLAQRGWSGGCALRPACDDAHRRRTHRPRRQKCIVPDRQRCR